MSSVLLYQPLGLGDYIICNGLVREYCKQYDRVGLFCFTPKAEAVKYMYRDVPNLTVEVVEPSHRYVDRFLRLNRFRWGKRHYGRIQVISVINSESGVFFDRQFYQMGDIDFAKKWDSFYLQRDTDKEEALYKRALLPERYIFVHDDNRFPLDRAKIYSSLPIFEPTQALSQNMFEYCTILERAEEIHVIDSSFMFLVDALPYTNPSQKLVVHRYARPNATWNLPVLKKNWNILLAPPPYL